ncbi:hypothetical protein EV182_001855 [Spiromyces aspiralis]|uniref:Uncharacterized protein n=1 Tax=Spiromyces aspiralis TaxID=68401 RepID=A0ACC1HTG0_9FUNG|nr:hypothetical protein EV182_001855 [Spiromyces aspiralis]
MNRKQASLTQEQCGITASGADANHYPTLSAEQVHYCGAGATFGACGDEAKQQPGYLSRLSSIMQTNQGVIVVASSFLIQMFTTSINTMMGIYQAYYLNVTFRDESASQISWIATTAAACIYGMFVFGGILVEHIGTRTTSYIGLTITVTGYILASLSVKIWQLVLTQGLLIGTGAALLNSAAIITPLGYFEKRKGLAISIADAGGAVGATILPPLIQLFIGRYGLHWAIRMVGLMTLAVCGPVAYFQRCNSDALGGRGSKHGADGRCSGGCDCNDYDNSSSSSNDDTEQKASANKATSFALFGRQTLMSAPLWLLFFTNCFMKAGTNSVSNYLVASALFYKFEDSKSSILPTLMNIAYIFGNIALGFLMDRVSAVFVLIGSISCSALLVFSMWYTARSFAAFASFAAVYGLLGQRINNIIPILAEEFFGVKHLPSLIGLIWVGVLFGSIAGNFSLAKVYDRVDKRGRFSVTILVTGAIFCGALVFGVLLGIVYWRRWRREPLSDV